MAIASLPGHPPPGDRLHSLDALRAFALLLGIFFHGAAGYVENFPLELWPMREPSSTTLGAFFYVSHMFRMSLFFLLAGFFGRMMLARRGTRAFVRDRAKRILLPLMVGVPVVLITIGLFAVLGSLLGGTDLATLQAAAQPPDVEGPTFSWAHLWFLYYLVMFYALALGARAVVHRIDRRGRVRAAADALLRFVLRGVRGAAFVGLPLAAYFSSLEGWSSWTGLPAPVGLAPDPGSVLAYGTAFAVGWLAHRQPERLFELAQRWLPFAVLAAMLTAVSYRIGGATPRFEPYLEGGSLLLYSAAYLVGAWCWIFALLGLAMRYLSNVSPVRRYLADASYWMYIMHLSVLAFFAVWLNRLPWHWTIKYPIQVAGTIVVLLVSYHYLVRPTFIGATLNGRRYPRGSAGPVAPGHEAHDVFSQEGHEVFSHKGHEEHKA